MFDLFHVGDADLDRTNLRSLKDPVESAREDRSLSSIRRFAEIFL